MEMAYGIEAVQKWQTAEAIISIKDDDGNYDEIPIQRVPNSHFPKLFKIGIKFQNSPTEITEQDIKEFVDLIATSICNANKGLTMEQARNFVITKFSDVSKGFMDANGGAVTLDDIPQDVKDALGV